MLNRDQIKLLMPINLFHTMAHIFPYFLPILCQVIRDEVDFLNYTRAGIISMTSILVMIPLTFALGFIGDKIRKWRFELIAIGFAIVVSHTFIIFIANSFATLVVAAVIGGIGAAVFHPIALPLLSQEFGAHRNRAHSINLIFGTLGSIITPIATIGLSNWVGWRKTTLILGLFGVICLPILITMLLLTKKHLKYEPKKSIVMGERVISVEINGSKYKKKKYHLPAFITLPLIALMLALVLRTGIFRIMNTFTSFIFEDRFGTSKFTSALIMSLVLGAGGISALISGYVSSKIGSLKTFLSSKIATLIATIGIVIFITILQIKNLPNTIGLLAIAIILFVILSASFYHSNPSANSILAEVIPLEILSSIYGIIVAVETAFSAIVPVIFGAIVDRDYTLPYEYLLPIILSLLPLLLLIYVKSKIGFKTPEQVEKERAEKVSAQINNSSSSKS